MAGERVGLPSTWPPGDELSEEYKLHSLVELSNYLDRVSTVDPPVLAPEVLAEIVPDNERPTSPAPLIPIELVQVPRLDGRGHQWVDALRIVEAEMPLRSSAPEPARKRCEGCGRCTPRKTLKARKHARRARA